tara:strand:+ start:459 stop:617 length:159 start_codon:yes stop_codon:yes gene_type:complete
MSGQPPELEVLGSEVVVAADGMICVVNGMLPYFFRAYRPKPESEISCSKHHR